MVVRRGETLIRDIRPGEVVHRQVPLLEHDPRVQRVDHGNAVQESAHAPPERFEGDVVVDRRAPEAADLDGVDGLGMNFGHGQNLR